MFRRIAVILGLFSVLQFWHTVCAAEENDFYSLVAIPPSSLFNDDVDVAAFRKFSDAVFVETVSKLSKEDGIHCLSAAETVKTLRAHDFSVTGLNLFFEPEKWFAGFSPKPQVLVNPGVQLNWERVGNSWFRKPVLRTTIKISAIPPNGPTEEIKFDVALNKATDNHLADGAFAKCYEADDQEHLIAEYSKKAVSAIKTKLALMDSRTAKTAISKPASTTAQPVQANLDSGQSNKPVADKWALIVGVSQFKDSRVPKLRYSAKDARDFREYLVKEAGFAPDHVRLLVNEQATEKRVMSEIGDKFIARVAKPDDLVVLYFSTHGSPAAADLRQRNYVLAYDTEVDNLFATGIEMQKILDIIKDRANSGRVLLVLDACHSGAAGPGAKAFGSSGNFDAEALAQGSGQLVICSSQPNERSWESSRYDNGIFTRKLLDGLRINGKSTKLGDAFEYVKKSVAAEAREAHGASQSPVLRSKWDGNDLMIACPTSAPSAVPPEVKAGLQPDSSQLVVPSTNQFSSKPSSRNSKSGSRNQLNR